MVNVKEADGKDAPTFHDVSTVPFKRLSVVLPPSPLQTQGGLHIDIKIRLTKTLFGGLHVKWITFSGSTLWLKRLDSESNKLFCAVPPLGRYYRGPNNSKWLGVGTASPIVSMSHDGNKT